MKFFRFLSPRRWENYALLAMASVAFLICTAVRVDAIQMPTRSDQVAPTKKIRPESRSDEAYWVKRHAKIVEKASEIENVDVLFLGDSITQGFENNYVWNYHYRDLKVINAGISSDRVEHILWRVQQGLVKESKPKVVVLLAGINNLGMATPEYTASGIGNIIDQIRKDSPSTKILVQGIFPSGKLRSDVKRDRIKKANALIAKYHNGSSVHFIDFGSKFLSANGQISRKMMFDYLHLTTNGYHIWARSIEEKLSTLLGTDQTT
jgi:lysophospholipase L1-like esterase